MINENYEAMIQAARDSVPTAFQQHFEAAMGQKVAEKIEALQPQVAKTMFGGEGAAE